MSARLFERVALIGVGLIGSSLARVLRRDSPDTAIVACARQAETLAAVRRLGLADETTDDPAARHRARGDRQDHPAVAGRRHAGRHDGR